MNENELDFRPYFEAMKYKQDLNKVKQKKKNKAILLGMAGIWLLFSAMLTPITIQYSLNERGYWAIGGELILPITAVFCMFYIIYRATQEVQEDE